MKLYIHLLLTKRVLRELVTSGKQAGEQQGSCP